jgi:hypothetical protein
MERVELLTVSDSFDITGRGLVVLPDFSVPPAGWKDRKIQLTIVTPTGQTQEATASVFLTHLVLSDRSASADRRNRVVMMILGLARENIPIGSRLFSSRDLLEELSKKQEPKQG